MSFMFEVLYKPPTDSGREAMIEETLGHHGGRLTSREEPDLPGVGPICLTYEFADWQEAHQAATCLRSRGEHVEGPIDYGD